MADGGILFSGRFCPGNITVFQIALDAVRRVSAIAPEGNFGGSFLLLGEKVRTNARSRLQRGCLTRVLK